MLVYSKNVFYSLSSPNINQKGQKWFKHKVENPGSIYEMKSIMFWLNSNLKTQWSWLSEPMKNKLNPIHAVLILAQFNPS